MDKKMHNVTEKMKEVERDIKQKQMAPAIKKLHNAEKSNEKLVKIDKEVRDPLVEKAKHMKKCK